MAQKMTKKERREAAKRARLEAQRQAAKKRVVRRIYGAVAVLAAIGLITYLVVRSQQQSAEQVATLNEAAAAASCDPLEQALQDGRTHVAPGSPVSYQTNPPTSGDHFGGTGPTGVIENPIPDGNLVHNLEHGHVIFWHGPDASPAIVEALNGVVGDDPEWRLSVPREGMPTPVAFSAWGTVMRCDGTGSPDQIAAAAESFTEATGRKAPEDIPGSPAGA